MSLQEWDSFLDDVKGDSQMAIALSLLFESSDVLLDKLVPELLDLLTDEDDVYEPYPESYHDLVDLCVRIVSEWPADERASFISSHPRIGEVANLSALSEAEQASKATPPDVLRKLELLNALYEEAYPGLRYITFVNGRSRAEIVPEMEDVLGFDRAIDPSRPIVAPDATVHRYNRGDPEWLNELDRALKAVGLIAKFRLLKLGFP